MRARFRRQRAAWPARLAVLLGLLVLSDLVLAPAAQAAPGSCISMSPGRLDCVAWEAGRQALIHVTDSGQGFGRPGTCRCRPSGSCRRAPTPLV